MLQRRSFSRFLTFPLSGVALGALFAVAGCSFNASSIGDGGFNILPDTSGPLAAGASTTVGVDTSGAQGSYAKSSDPTIVAAGPITDVANVNVTAGNPGTATLTVYNTAGAAIGSAALTVQATATIGLDPGVTSGLTVLTGEPFSVHATTLASDGSILVGDGGIHFAYQGSLASGDSTGLCSGDCGDFQAAAAGGGAVVMTAISATTTLTLHAVDPTSIDSITTSQTSVAVGASGFASVTYAMRAGGALVYGTLPCTVDDPSIAQLVVQPSQLVGTSSGTIAIIGNAAGSTSVTCTLGNHSITLPVTAK
jgi:hypothetical protein